MITKLIYLGVFFCLIQLKIVAQERNADNFQSSMANGDSIYTSWIARYASGLYSSNDSASAMTIDRSENIYVTGKSDSTFTGYDYLTVKFNSSGVLRWAARFDGGCNADDIPSAIAVDSNGNVFVTGQSYSYGASFDYCTIKYDSNGAQEWYAKHNGDANNLDIPTSIAIDYSGNIIITGYSNRVGTHFDFATIKYDKNGDELWIAYYDGPANYYDIPTVLVVDDSNNVYVTGSSTGIGTSRDYITIKYNADGVHQWTATYNGPGNSYDLAFDIKLDREHNVYVTGGSTGIGTSRDYTTIKYNADGIQQWIATYNGPGNSDDYAFAMAIDDSENVYITGWSEGTGTYSDYATIKYNSRGEELWVARYNGPGNTYDFAYDIAIDDSNDLYVTGSSGDNSSTNALTIKYNSNGLEQWRKTYAGSAFAIRTKNKGDVIVLGQLHSDKLFDYLILNYNSDGGLQWFKEYDGTGISVDNVKSCSVDKNGNIYVTGESYTALGSRFTTIKYDAQGTLQWVKHFRDSTAPYNTPYSIAVDVSGYIYVMGECIKMSVDTSYYVVIKYNSSGEEQWITKYTGSENFLYPGNLLAVDSVGNVYISITSQEDYVTIKYNSDGNQQWAMRYDSFVGFSIDAPTALAIDAFGNVYVTGSSSARCATIKYNSDGTEQWAVRYNDSTSAANSPKEIAIDNIGNVYVIGSIGFNPNSNYLTIKYDSSGNQLWVRQYDGTANGSDKANGLVIDESNNIYVTGRSLEVGTSADYATIKYSPNGDEQWVARYSGEGNGIDEPAVITIDHLGDIYITGKSVGPDSTWNFTSIKYTPAGNTEWISIYNDPLTSLDEPKNIVVDSVGNVYIAGSSMYNNWSIFTVIKYNQIKSDVKDIDNKLPVKFFLAQNYPNPFNPSTTISFSLPHAGYVRLSVLNILGQEITVLLNAERQAGTYTASWDGVRYASGVYFYRLMAGNFSQTRKLVLMK